MAQTGRIEDFFKQLEHLKEMEISFSVEMSGVTRKIQYHDAKGAITHEEVYFGFEGQKKMEGLEFVRMVRREILERIERGEKPPKSKAHTQVLAFHENNLIDVSKKGETVVAIDLNACYWNTAYKLGFLSEPLFKKGWKKRREAKLGLVSSIGSLNKRTFSEKFEFGVSNGVQKTNKDDNLRPYYWAVINEVNRIMNHTIAELPKNDFLMWLTDCVYVRKPSVEKAQSVFTELGYEYKMSEARIEKVDDNCVFWTNLKNGEMKSIFFSPDITVKS